MADLSRMELDVLQLIGKCGRGGGFAVRHISFRLYPGFDARTASARTMAVCRGLERREFLRRLDTMKPVIWCITESGRAALSPTPHGGTDR